MRQPFNSPNVPHLSQLLSVCCLLIFLCVRDQARLAYVEAEGQLKISFEDRLPTREEQLAALQNTQEFDVLVVGGGATGSGCALDAVTRSERKFTV